MNEEPGTAKTGKLYNVFPGSLTDRLGAYGITHIPGILAIMQEIGLTRMRKRKHPTIWEICDNTFFDGFMDSEETVTRCIEDANRHRADSDELSRLRKTASTGCHEEEAGTEATLAEIAALLVENEDLEKENANLRQKLAEVERAGGISISARLAEAVRKAREERRTDKPA